LRSAKKDKGRGKTLQTVLSSGMLLVGRRDRPAICLMLAKLREGDFVKSGRLGELACRDRQQQRLHHQGIDRNGADQPSPEQAQLRAGLIWSGWHAQALVAIQGRGRDEPGFDDRFKRM
jgi:hypothetical protein